MTAARNAYGRQLGSFHTEAPFKGIDGDIPMTFIRAPYIRESADEVETLSAVDGHIVAARQGNQLVTAFHPELDSDMRVHEYFLEMVKGR
jgi:glutamine amidotransferase subunit pdxT